MDLLTLGAAVAMAKGNLDKVVAPVTAADAGMIATVDSNGKYQAAALTVGQGEVAVDSTLLVSGAAADAMVTGDKLGELKSAINALDAELTGVAGINKTVTPTWTKNKRIGEDGSIVNSGDSFGYTDKITIIEAEKYIAYGTNSGSAFSMPSIHFYNSSDVHLGYLYTDGDYDFTSAVAQYSPEYIRISHYAVTGRPFDGVSVKFESEGALDEIENTLNSTVMSRLRDPHNMLTGVGLSANRKHDANKQDSETASGYSLTDLIPVEPEKLYAMVTDSSLSGAGYGDMGLPATFAQYAEDKSIILQSNNGYGVNVETGSTTKYITISAPTSSFSDNAILTEAPFVGLLANPTKKIDDIYKSVSTDEISFKGKNTQFVNLLDGHRNSIAKGNTLSNGKISANANFMALTDYIPCQPSTDYNGAITIATSYNPSFVVAWYTDKGVFISDSTHANNTAFTSPATAAFFRIATIQKSTSYPNDVEDFDYVFFGESSVAYGPPCIDPSPVFTNIYPYSSLYGKTWIAFGDSITEKNVRSTINYHDYIRAETGINVVNKGLGGAGYKCRWQNDNNIFAIADDTDFSNADVITCMAGINDAWSDLTSNMGDATDTYDSEATAQNQSVMACFNHFIDVVISKAPYAKIGIISPLPCWTTQSSTDYHFKPDDNTTTLAVFVEKCKTACKNRGIPYLDLFHTSGLRPWDSTFNNTMFKCNTNDSPDGLHPNHLGHKFFYPLVREFLKKLI